MKPINKDTMRHSAAHILAAAVLEMFPEAKFGTGPTTEDGFYYDFDLPRTLIPEDLPLLEEKMKKIIENNQPFEKEDISIKSALDHFKAAGQPYKIELIKDLKKAGKEKVRIYKTGGFVDLCEGPHLSMTKEIKKDAIRLTKISGAYWRADENNKQMQRIYGVVFDDKKRLDEYLVSVELAKQRDHKKLGKELDLFSFHSESPGAPFWHPKGMIIWNELEKFGKSLRGKYKAKEIQTPQIAKNILWKTSGHWDHYKDGMFHFKVDNHEYCLKPMDCPFNILIYKTKQRSYKDLPIRYTETGRVLRNEKSGELNGLLRVRTITQDDSHVFSTPSQVEEEVVMLLKATKEYYQAFGIEPEFFLSTRPDDFMGKTATWDKAEGNLANALKKEKVKYEVKEKDGAFYGPKIDIDIKDALGRRWQLATIQLDFQMPERFKLEYIGKDGKKKQPVIIHAAIFGAYERFVGILLEHTGGKLPLWLSPVQVKVIPVSEKFSKYAEEVNKILQENNVRSEISTEAESVGKRISEAEKQKIPYMVVIGEREEKDKTVTIRERGSKDQAIIRIEEFSDRVSQEIKERK